MKHEHVDDPVTDGLDDQQIGGPDSLERVSQEGPPSLAATWRWLPPTVTADGALADDDAQLEQLATDAFAAPQWVVAGHRRDEIPNLALEARSAETRPRLPGPVQAPPFAMPAEHGFGLHDVKVVAPGRP